MWAARRETFGAASEKTQDDIEQTWREHHDGKATIDETRDEIAEKAGAQETMNDINELMKKAGVPLPEWTPEHESQLPEELQDWSLFELVNGELVLKTGQEEEDKEEDDT